MKTEFETKLDDQAAIGTRIMDDMEAEIMKLEDIERWHLNEARIHTEKARELGEEARVIRNRIRGGVK